MGVVGMRQPLKDYFWNTPTGWGSTFQAHPVALACGYETLKHLVSADILGHVQNTVQPVMIMELNRLAAKYTCVRQARAVGAFGCLDLQDPKTHEKVMQLGDPMPPAIANFKKAFNNEGLIGFVRPPQVHCAPPLIITEAELRDGFARLDRALGGLEAELK